MATVLEPLHIDTSALKAKVDALCENEAALADFRERHEDPIQALLDLIEFRYRDMLLPGPLQQEVPSNEPENGSNVQGRFIKI